MSWRDIQEKTFTRWVNDYLRERGMKVESLKDDMKDGLALINLMEVLSGKKLGRYNKHPTIIMQKQENLTIALNFIKAEGIHLVNIGASDINEGNLRLIMGLIWTLILRYEIKAGSDTGDSAYNELLEWVRSKIPEYNIQNFTTDWNNGKAICALTNAIKPGLIPDHQKKDPNNALANATHGIDTAEQALGIDKLVMPDEMIHPKVDKHAMMTYIAQFRNIPEHLLKGKEIDYSHATKAFGPGLVEGVAGQPADFNVEGPKEIDGKLEIKVEGPVQNIGVQVKQVGAGRYAVSYNPTVPGEYRVHVTVAGNHIPGSIFHVTVLEEESTGGEGKIRVFFSTTSSSEKAKRDTKALEALLTAKKVHLRPDFEPFYPIDTWDKKDRDAVFRKAGTRNLPIVFVNDRYVGDYDKLMELEEKGKLDDLLAMKGMKLISEQEHLERLKHMGTEGPAEGEGHQGHGEGEKKCPGCGAVIAAGKKFCTSCGHKI